MSKRIAVCGTGNIGACLATLTSGNGYETIVIGHSDAGMQRCENTLEQNWDDLINEGLATGANKKAAINLVTITNDYSAIKGCQMVFEAALENEEVKKGIFKSVTDNAGTDIPVASTTSSIDAKILADLIDNPSRLLIAHPFQPAHMLPLFELVKHEGTSDETVKVVRDILEDLKRKVVVLNKSVPGFLVNRFAQALFRESIYLIENGITSPEDIDTAVKYAMGMRYASIGLLEYYDDVGFELEKTIAENIYPDLCDTKEVQKTTNDGIALGNKGKKSGQGFYDWSKIDPDDYRRRKQAPYFDGVKDWNMPT